MSPPHDRTASSWPVQGRSGNKNASATAVSSRHDTSLDPSSTVACSAASAAADLTVPCLPTPSQLNFNSSSAATQSSKTKESWEKKGCCCNDKPRYPVKMLSPPCIMMVHLSSSFHRQLGSFAVVPSTTIRTVSINGGSSNGFYGQVSRFRRLFLAIVEGCNSFRSPCFSFLYQLNNEHLSQCNTLVGNCTKNHSIIRKKSVFV